MALGQQTREQVTRRVLASHPDLNNLWRAAVRSTHDMIEAQIAFAELVIARQRACPDDPWLELEANYARLKKTELLALAESLDGVYARVTEKLRPSDVVPISPAGPG